MAVTMDGTPLTDNYGLILIGFKVIQPGARDPVTGDFIDDWQSRDNGYPAIVALCGDSLEAYTLDGPIKQFLDRFGKELRP